LQQSWAPFGQGGVKELMETHKNKEMLPWKLIKEMLPWKLIKEMLPWKLIKNKEMLPTVLVSVQQQC